MGRARALKAQRRAARADVDKLVLWHGGVGGIRVGGPLLPPTIMGDPATVANYVRELRPDWVYLTTDREFARVFAAMVFDAYGHSALYRVGPVGGIETDPDFPEAGFAARRATIIEVAERDVRLTDSERIKRTTRYLYWDDGRPCMTRTGGFSSLRS